MQTGPQLVDKYIKDNNIDMEDFHEWFSDGGYPQEDANHHCSRYQELLELYVEERATRG